jgi:hypothetical protein
MYRTTMVALVAGVIGAACAGSAAAGARLDYPAHAARKAEQAAAEMREERARAGGSRLEIGCEASESHAARSMRSRANVSVGCGGRSVHIGHIEQRNEASGGHAEQEARFGARR